MTEYPHLNCSACPKCATRLDVKTTRANATLGFKTLYRRKECPKCGLRVSTAEVPLAVAKDVFPKEDAA